ncbi:mge1 [Scenedesmus sp. PABB004]|nr:mge1 [Scenedesmus sp. PABB004]
MASSSAMRAAGAVARLAWARAAQGAPGVAGAPALTQLLPALAQARPRGGWGCGDAWTGVMGPSGRHLATDGGETRRTGGAQAGDSSGDDDAGPRAAGVAADEAAGSSELSELQALLDKAQEEATSFKDRWQRSHAEMQNLIARQAREKETMQTYAVQKFAQSLLEVADNLESAAKAVPPEVLQPGAELSAEKALAYLRALLEGVQATERVLLKTMASKGVERIETAPGDAFDPNAHEAMSTVPAATPDAKPGSVAIVWQSGYKIHDRVLRAAKVIVVQE